MSHHRVLRNLTGHIRMTNEGVMLHLVVTCPITGKLRTFWLEKEEEE